VAIAIKKLGNNMISVVIPSYRNPKCLDICLKSAIENAKNINQIVVVIDGHPEESEHIAQKYKDKVLFINLEKNSGMQHALNIGVYQSLNEWILIVNDDNVFPKDWDILLEQDISDRLIITPNQIERSPSIFDFVTKDFGNVDNFDFESYTKQEPEYREDSLTNDGEIFPFFMQKKYYMACGGFDTIYDSPFICDWDFFLKLELIGLKFIRSRKLNFYHFGSMATKNSNERKRFLQSETDASETFKFKWGFEAIRNIDNSHSPKNYYIMGINYE
jgi:glycosyltransferase involved in cell wall biosynthesis